MLYWALFEDGKAENGRWVKSGPNGTLERPSYLFSLKTQREILKQEKT